MNTPSTPKPPDLSNITRFDYGNSHGWWVRVRRHGKRHTKLFSDGAHGSREQALQAALAYRDKLLTELGEPGQGLRGPGVRLIVKDDIATIAADHYDAGDRSTRSWSIAKWGLRRALWQACTWKTRHVMGTPTPEQVQQLYHELYPQFKTSMEELELAPEEMEESI